MFIKKLLNNNFIYFITSVIIGIIIFNFILGNWHFLFLDTSIPWSREAWNMWLNDHIYAWNNFLWWGYSRATYFSQGTTFFIINSIVSIFWDINISFFVYYLWVFSLGTFFGYKFINLYIDNKIISYCASLLIFINPFSIQWINLYVFYIALFWLTLSLYWFVKYLRTNKIIFLLLFGVGSLFLFTYQRFIFAFIFIFFFILLFENTENLKKIFSKQNTFKYIKMFFVLVFINGIWLFPIILNKIDGEVTIDGYEHHLHHNEVFERQNIYNWLYKHSDFVKFININDTTENYAHFFQNYYGDNNLLLFFPFLIFTILVYFLIIKKDKKYIFILWYLLVVYFLLLSFKFLSIDNYSALAKYFPALSVTHFYFQLAIIPIFALVFGYILQDLWNKRAFIYPILILYFVTLVYPLVLWQSIYQNKEYNEYKISKQCHYSNFETLVYPFWVRWFWHIVNDTLLSYYIWYNNCFRFFNWSIFQNSTVEWKTVRDKLFYANFFGFSQEILEKFNIGEIILLNESILKPEDLSRYKSEYPFIKTLLRIKWFKLIENNKYFQRYQVFDKNIRWEFNWNWNLSVFPVNYSQYLINVWDNANWDLLFKESYHKKWKLYKVDDKICKINTVNSWDWLTIHENEAFNSWFLSGISELFLFSEDDLKDRIKIVFWYLTNIKIDWLHGCYMYFFKPQLYFYIWFLSTTLSLIFLTTLMSFQELKNFFKKK